MQVGLIDLTLTRRCKRAVITGNDSWRRRVIQGSDVVDLSD